MTDPATPAIARPRRYPLPEFPPRRPAAFSRTPPAVFPVILGLLGAGLALRLALARAGQPLALAEILLGAVLALWLFAVLALAAKYLRRGGALGEDLATLPGQAGVAAAGMGGMAAAGALAPHAPRLALALVTAALLLHGLAALALMATLRRLPAERRQASPSWHLSFTGFIVAAPPLAALGQEGVARGLFWAMLVVALAIWVASARQALRQVPPAPLRPLLVIHVAPLALLATTATATGLAGAGGALGLLVAAALVLAAALARWILAAGFTPFWGALTFPLAASAIALMTQRGVMDLSGVALAVLALGVNFWIAWRVLRLWPGGRLAQMTNAAEA